jgi:MYXO-CTERM domain-containing protein
MIRATTRGLFLPAWLAAAACLLAPGAHASVSTAIDVTGLQVSVVAIAPGSTPAVSFPNAGGSTAQSMASAGVPPATWLVTAASGSAFGQTSTATWAGALAGSSATLSGDVFGAGGAVHTSAFASSRGPDAIGQGTIGLGDGVSAALFTLAPGTRMTITATVCATASVTGSSPFEYADSGLSLALSDSDGVGSQFVRFTFDAFALGLFGPFEDVETTTVSLVYENDTDAAITGLFSGYVGSIAYSGNPVSAVPEAGGAAMFLVGLAALAGWRRQRIGR